MGETCGQVIHVRPLGQNEDTQSKRPGTDDRKLHPLTFKYIEFTEKEKLGSWAHSEPRNKKQQRPAQCLHPDLTPSNSIWQLME